LLFGLEFGLSSRGEKRTFLKLDGDWNGEPVPTKKLKQHPVSIKAKSATTKAEKPLKPPAWPHDNGGDAFLPHFFLKKAFKNVKMIK
jgi:hypothetical protein